MKKISKLMLAAVASVALAAPAFAWDFSASGSSSATFNVTNTTQNSASTQTITSGGVGSEDSGLSLSSSHTDGKKNLGLSYTLDFDGNLDETIALSGSSTVGDWTASGAISYNRDSAGCSNAASDNGTGTALLASAQAACGAVGSAAEESRTAVTLTDGTMTIKLGNASHLSSQNVSSGTTASGAVSFDPADDDASVGAFVGSFQGVSLGYAVSDTISVTAAYQKDGSIDDMCGAGENYDGENSTTFGTTGTGFGFNGTFGIVAVGATLCSASTADAGTYSTDATSNSTSSSTLGFGATLDLGDIKPFLSFGTYVAAGSVSKEGVAYAGNEIGLTYALGADTVTFYMGSTATIATGSDGVAGQALSVSGMELGYATMVGPASLGIGYGSQTKAQAVATACTAGDATCVDGYSMTDIDVTLGYSF